MALLIFMESVFFSGFIVTYLFYIGRSSFGPQPAQVLELGPVIVNSVCLWASSITVWFAVRSLRRGSLTGFRVWMLITVLLGIEFIVGTAMEWKGLIEDHEIGVGDQRLRDAHPLEHSLGESTERSISGVGETHQLQKGVNALPAHLARELIELTVEVEDLEGGEVVIEERMLREIADPPADGRIHDVSAEDANGARRRLDQPHGHLHAGRLSGAVRTEISEDLSRLDLQIDPAHSVHASQTQAELELLLQTLEHQGRR